MFQRQRRVKLSNARNVGRRGGSPLSVSCTERLLVSLLLLMMGCAGFVYYRFYSEDMYGSASSLRAVEKFPPHLYPRLPFQPPFAAVDDAEKHAADTLAGRPTLAGVHAILQKFLMAQHRLNYLLADGHGAHGLKEVIRSYFDLAQIHVAPLEEAYRGRSVFPVREDGSLYMSLAAFREHLLAQTLFGAFRNAAHPEKLFIGAVVQQCFGRVDADGNVDPSGKPCRTGAQVIGKNAAGRDMTRVSDAPPDVDGIAEFCGHPDFEQYCRAGQIRVLYVHETESLGPAMARYYASRLWGGETYFVQMDAHLQFARGWDAKFVAELKAAKSYPKAVLSSYPPGFGNAPDGSVRESPGARLCTCEFSRSDIEKDIIRINSGAGYQGGEKEPRQIPFIAAGFFFARAEFLVDVPFDPYMPWCFMGEEIALSTRAWTSGWDIYAPRKNLFAHQYRPGRMGLPKFWGSVNRLYGHVNGINNNNLQGQVIDRVKHLIGYAESTKEKIEERGLGFILKNQDIYGHGTERTLEQYLTWTGIDVKNKRCNNIQWCNQASVV